MTSPADLEYLRDEMTTWRRDIHAHPETAFEEHRTAELVATKLAEFGLDVHRGLGGTGVVATLTNGVGPTLGLRADMDALHIQEAGDKPYRSTVDGKMHACGHDGHTAMLLGAAKHLSANRNFSGTVQFVFQPAEENEGGAQKMVEDGLFAQFPMDEIYGLHNWPAKPAGEFAIQAGPIMAAYDVFEMIITGKGSHGAMPHLGVDPVVAAAQVIGGLQTIASRGVDPMQSVVLSVTKIHGGDTWNVIPDQVVLGGTTRSFDPAVRDSIEPAMRRIAQGICAAAGAQMELDYQKRYPPTINAAVETEHAALAAEMAMGTSKVARVLTPSMGAEDFSFMLAQCPGAYIWMGGGRAGENDVAPLHNPNYDFNDDVLTVGAAYWSALTETRLPKG